MKTAKPAAQVEFSRKAALLKEAEQQRQGPRQQHHPRNAKPTTASQRRRLEQCRVDHRPADRGDQDDEDDVGDEPDALVPDPVVWREFGISSMTLWRWSRDPNRLPPQIKIRERNFRSRRQLEEFKARMLRVAIKQRTEVEA